MLTIVRPASETKRGDCNARHRYFQTEYDPRNPLIKKKTGRCNLSEPRSSFHFITAVAMITSGLSTVPVGDALAVKEEMSLESAVVTLRKLDGRDKATKVCLQSSVRHDFLPRLRGCCCKAKHRFSSNMHRSIMNRSPQFSRSWCVASFRPRRFQSENISSSPAHLFPSAVDKCKLRLACLLLPPAS